MTIAGSAIPTARSASAALGPNDSGGLDDAVADELRAAAVDAIAAWSRGADPRSPSPARRCCCACSRWRWARTCRRRVRAADARGDGFPAGSRPRARAARRDRRARLPGRHHRGRGLGDASPRCGSQRAGRPVRDPRAQRRRRWRLAGPTLPRRGRRHAELPVLVLVLPAELVDALRQARRDGRPTRATSPTTSTCASTSSSASTSRWRPGTTTTQRWTVTAGTAQLDARAGRDQRRRAVQHAEDPRPCRAWTRSAGRCSTPRDWPDDLDVTGKRVAVVGTGASAMQIVPGDRRARRRTSTVFQRSPQWVAPNDEYFAPVGDDVHWLMEHVPFYHALVPLPAGVDLQRPRPRVAADRPGLGRTPSARSTPSTTDTGRYFTRYLEQRARRPAGPDRRSALPDYPPFGKRMLLDNGWYAALRRDDVELVTDSVAADHRDRRGDRGRRRASRPTSWCCPPGFEAQQLPARDRGPRARRPPSCTTSGAPTTPRAPRHHRPRLPEPVPDVRPQHQRRARAAASSSSPSAQVATSSIWSRP